MSCKQGYVMHIHVACAQSLKQLPGLLLREKAHASVVLPGLFHAPSGAFTLNHITRCRPVPHLGNDGQNVADGGRAFSEFLRMQRQGFNFGGVYFL